MDNADVIEQFYAFCGRVWESFCGVVKGYIGATEEAEFDVDCGVAFFLAVVILFFLGSACWAASIAGSRRYNQIPHFLLGLVLPWIYPAVILFTMEIKGQKEMRIAAEKERIEKEAAEQEKQKNIALNMGTEEEQEEKQESIFTQEHFLKIMRKEDGTPAGPWRVVFSGNEMHVVRIIEPLPELVSVEVMDDKGKTFTMRIPYAKMESWEDA